MRQNQAPVIVMRGAAPRRALVAAAIALLVGSAAARAGVTCSVTTAGVAFGTYSPLATVADVSVGTIKVTCNHTAGAAATANYTLQLSAGSSGVFNPRDMASGTKKLGYNLYKDAAHTQILGTGSGGTYTITGSLTVSNGVPTQSQSYSLYGQVPAQQDVGAGSYSDAIVATLNY